jgi:hypothetical protein
VETALIAERLMFGWDGEIHRAQGMRHWPVDGLYLIDLTRDKIVK